MGGKWIYTLCPQCGGSGRFPRFGTKGSTKVGTKIGKTIMCAACTGSGRKAEWVWQPDPPKPPKIPEPPKFPKPPKIPEPPKFPKPPKIPKIDW